MFLLGIIKEVSKIYLGELDIYEEEYRKNKAFFLLISPFLILRAVLIGLVIFLKDLASSVLVILIMYPVISFWCIYKGVLKDLFLVQEEADENN